MVCRGPFDKNAELTLLIGAIEKDRKLPNGVAKAAERNRRAIVADAARRRPHEWLEEMQAEGEATT